MADTQEPVWVGTENVVLDQDQAIHSWYRFVLSFPPHLVRSYLQDFGLGPGDTVLDPFCGTGTTLVEAKLSGIGSIGIEAAPMAHFASATKVDWSPSPDSLLRTAEGVCASASKTAEHEIKKGSLRGLSEEANAILLRGSISPLPLHRALVLLDEIDTHFDTESNAHARLALARILPSMVGNLRFGPEVGVSKKAKHDAPVAELWINEVEKMARDLEVVAGQSPTPSRAVNADSRSALASIADGSLSAVFTSPPYPNEKDYTRTTRLESVLLGFFRSKAELRAYKETLLRSNTRNVYKADQDDDFVSDIRTIQDLASEIERRRIAMNKTSGFERLYARVTKLYFGGMARHLAELRPKLRAGAMLGYVVGDQASYLRVHIKTGEILAEVAEGLGYEVVRIDLFRTRPSTATKAQLREEVLVLRWPG